MTESVRKPSSMTEAWMILKGYALGDPEQAETLLQDPDRVEKGRAERQALTHLRTRRRPLGSKGLAMLDRNYK